MKTYHMSPYMEFEKKLIVNYKFIILLLVNLGQVSLGFTFKFWFKQII